MSIELFVYMPTANPPMRAQITAMMRKQGWVICFGKGLHGLDLVTDGVLEDDDLVWGWFADAPTAKQIPSLLKAGDMPALDALAQREQIGSAGIYLTSDIDKEEYADMIGEDPPKDYKKELDAMQLLATVRTSAGRTVTGYHLQYTLWHVLGLLSHGIIVDPQEGEWHPYSTLADQLRSFPHNTDEFIKSVRRMHQQVKGGLDKNHPKRIYSLFDIALNIVGGIVLNVMGWLIWGKSTYSYFVLLIGLLCLFTAAVMLMDKPWARWVERANVTVAFIGLIWSHFAK